MSSEEPQTSGASGEPDESEAFGPWLRRQREGREIELREISEASKISLGYLQALEQGRFDVLPAPVFTKGFLRQYAGYIGLDPEEVINAYLAARQAQDDAEEPRHDPPPRRGGRGARNLRLVLVFLVVAALLVALVWFLAQMRASQNASSPGGGPPPDAAAPVTSTLGGPAGTERRVADVSPGAESSAAAGGAPSATEPTEQGPPLRVVLDFRGDCWIEAQIDGERRLAELRVQGESLRLDASRWIELKVGNHEMVDVERNGEPFDLEALAEGTGAVREVRFEVEEPAASSTTASPGTTS